MPSNQTIYLNLTAQQLIDQAVQRKEGVLAANSALSVVTGWRTGRSPKDKFIVKTAQTAEFIDWGNVNQAVEEDKFFALWKKAETYAKAVDLFISDLQVGADPVHYLPVKVITELAWHNLFAHQLFIRPEHFLGAGDKPIWTMLSLPGFKTDPVRDGTHSDATLIIHFDERKVLLCGHQYAGEMKKAMFSVLNYCLPELDVLPMHCAANLGQRGDVALFFGLSGTGKTTLSADPERYLIGDDEHGWSDSGVFNFEGGCYAKCIHLSAEQEPMIWRAIRYGALMENVVLNPDTLEPNYEDARLTQNTRVAYPLDFVDRRTLKPRVDRAPETLIFLTCDLYGILPPLAKLTKEQAAYYFVSGYTALVGSTEVGQSEAIKATFSRCFGAPFFPRPVTVYAELLMKRLGSSGAQVYLVNTGWTGGGYGQGQRFSIPVTRSIISSILTGNARTATYSVLPGFKLAIPNDLPNIDSNLLDPRKTWKNPLDYDQQARALSTKFIANAQKMPLSKNILEASPDFV